MQLLAIDMDGTLLNSQGHISIENRQALADFIMQANGSIAICSARPLITLMRLLDEEQVLHLVRYIAGFNGAQIFDTKKQALIFDCKMTLPDLQDIGAAININQYSHHYFTDKEMMHIDNQTVSSYSIYESRFFSLPLNFYSLTEINHSTDIYKITVCGDEEEMSLFQENISRQLPEKFSGMITGSNYIDIQPVNINKGTAIERIKLQRQLTTQDVIAIGDQQNDLPMFHVSGKKIAMGNAVKMLQNEADIVTRSNDQHGVAWAIKWLISM